MFIALLTAAAVLFSGCKGESSNSVTGVTLNLNELSLKVGRTQTLTATVAPANADNKNVTWSSDDDDIATVDPASGLVTAVSVGDTVITVTTEDGGKTDACNVSVTNVSVTSVGLNKNELALEAGDSEILEAIVIPSSATDQSVLWSSGDDEIATVGASTGEVTGIASGKTVITATTTDGGLTAECEVTVKISVQSVSLNKDALAFKIGGDDVLVATVLPENATKKAVAWSSDRPEIASVHPTRGHVTGLSVGEAVITATTADGAKTDICTVTVTDPVEASAPKYNNVNGLVANCADPYILQYDGKYYLYGTGGSDGIRVHTSTDLVNWTINQGATSGYALHKNNVWGTSGFWAPEVYHLNNKFYMFYTANERLSMATATDPKGPFTTASGDQKAFHADTPEIDSHMFIDDNGKKYLYFVRFTDGNVIWGAELNDDMVSIKENTLVRCITAAAVWERQQDRVAEGPFILKHGGVYYLTYSANHYQSKKYAVGYAYSDNPLGPWTKSPDSPILIGDDTNITGTGHHSFLYSPSARFI